MYYVTGAVAKSPSSSRGAACMYIRIGVSDGAQGMRRRDAGDAQGCARETQGAHG